MELEAGVVIMIHIFLSLHVSRPCRGVMCGYLDAVGWKMSRFDGIASHTMSAVCGEICQLINRSHGLLDDMEHFTHLTPKRERRKGAKTFKSFRTMKKHPSCPADRRACMIIMSTYAGSAREILVSFGSRGVFFKLSSGWYNN